MTSHYDFIVIGGGSGGLAAAKRAAHYGARTVVIEKGPLGGTCVNVGCIPKKVMWNTATLAEAFHDAPDYGFELELSGFDWQGLKRARDAHIKQLNENHRRHLERAGVDLVEANAQFVNKETIETKGNQYTSDHILIATGSHPEIPAVPGAELGITSDDFFQLEYQPGHVAIIGSGYIAVELAGILNALGSEVTLFLRRQHPLTRFDPLLQEGLTEAMNLAGIQFVTETQVASLEQLQNKCYAVVSAHGRRTGGFDCVLWATGRPPSVSSLHLEAAGVTITPEGGIWVDKFQNTTSPGIYAVGDVTNRAPLTPVAIAAGRKLADRVFGGQQGARLDYRNIPSVVFSHPPIGTVGLTQKEAEAHYGPEGYKAYTTRFKDTYYVPCRRQISTAMKVITAGPEEHLVGIHVIGRGADEMIQGFAVAVKAGATKADLESSVAIHPTSAEELVLIG